MLDKKDKKMDTSNILTEKALKLKTKVVIFSGVSLFIGLTKTLPTELSLIGLSLVNSPKVLGWFLFSITTILFINFFVVLVLDYVMYFKKNILHFKGKNFTGNTIGLTYKEIGEEYDKQEDTSPAAVRDGSLGDEAEDINRQFKALENDKLNWEIKSEEIRCNNSCQKTSKK